MNLGITQPQTKAQAANHGAIIGFLAGLGAIAAQWLIGALSGNTLNLPPALTPIVPLITALLGYALPWLIYERDSHPTPAPVPPAPPAVGP